MVKMKLSIILPLLSQQYVSSNANSPKEYKMPPHPAQNRVLASTEKTIFSDIKDLSSISKNVYTPPIDIRKHNTEDKSYHRKLEISDENIEENKNAIPKSLSPDPKKVEVGWWKKLGEIPDPEHDNGIPSSRRSLSSSIFKTVKGTPDIVTDESDIQTNETLTLDGEYEQLQNGQELEVNDKMKDVARNKDVSESAQDLQEWMIVSGGFTDDDWSTFPVWAYDITESRITGKGTWIPLQIITPHHKMESQTTDADSSDEGINNVEKNGPTARVGHMTIVNEGYLYVYGGLMFKEGVFFPDSKFTMWRAKISDLLGENRKEIHEREGDIRLDWEFVNPMISPDVDESATKNLPRGEAEGDLYYKVELDSEGNEYKKPLWIFHGGLTTKLTGTSMGRRVGPISVDIPLSDMWSYDFDSNTLELLDVACDLETLAHCATSPIARTAHAGTIINDEFIIYGGMTTFFDADFFGEMGGGQKWEMLSDVWSFNLITKTWRKWDMNQTLGRSYHSMVGWKPIPVDEDESENRNVEETAERDSVTSGVINDELEINGRDRGSIVSYGGFRTYETMAGESIAFVFSDVLMAHPPKTNSTGSDDGNTFWYKAQWPPGSPEAVSHRLEHSSVIDSAGTMYVWGGRFQDVNQITGIYGINIFGPHSSVQFKIAETDGLDVYEAQLEKLHLLVAVMILMSILFTALYGTLRRQAQEGANTDGNGVSMFLGRRSGVAPEIIDTIPVKTYIKKSRSCSPVDSNAGADTITTSDSSQPISTSNRDDEEEVCPICLLEYEEGDKLRCLPCNHEFHKDCVDSWLVNNTSCPACRSSVCGHVSDELLTSNNAEGNIDASSPEVMPMPSFPNFYLWNSETSRGDNNRDFFSRRNRRLNHRRWFGAIRRGMNGHATVSSDQYVSSLDLEEDVVAETEMTPQNIRSNGDSNRTDRLARNSTRNLNGSRVRGGFQRALRRGDRDTSLNLPLTDSDTIV